MVYPLRVYKKILNCDNFIVVNRSYLINFDHIIDIQGYYLQLTGNTSIPIGYSKASKASVHKKYMLYTKERI